MQNPRKLLFKAFETTGHSHNVFQSSLGVGRRHGVPRSDGGGEEAFNGGPIKMGEHLGEMFILLSSLRKNILACARLMVLDE